MRLPQIPTDRIFPTVYIPGGADANNFDFFWNQGRSSAISFGNLSLGGNDMTLITRSYMPDIFGKFSFALELQSIEG